MKSAAEIIELINARRERLNDLHDATLFLLAEEDDENERAYLKQSASEYWSKEIELGRIVKAIETEG